MCVRQIHEEVAKTIIIQKSHVYSLIYHYHLRLLRSSKSLGPAHMLSLYNSLLDDLLSK